MGEDAAEVGDEAVHGDGGGGFGGGEAVAFEVVEDVAVGGVEVGGVDEGAVELGGAAEAVDVDDGVRAGAEFDDVDELFVDLGETGAAAADVEVVHWDAGDLRNGFQCLVGDGGIGDAVGEFAEAGDGYFDCVARLEERWWILAEAYTSWRPRC